VEYHRVDRVLVVVVGRDIPLAAQAGKHLEMMQVQPLEAMVAKTMLTQQ
jgi:hypothetical protein